MANSFKTDFIEITSTTSQTTALRGSASTTIVKQIYFSHDNNTATVELYFKDTPTSAARKIAEVTHSAGDMTPLLSDVINLESTGQILLVKDNQSSATHPSYLTVVYVENTTSVSGQSIDVLTDVDISTSAPTNGQTLVWNDSTNEFEPGDAGGSTATLDDIGNVDTTGKAANDVLLWNGSNWVDSNRLTEVYSLLKQGSSKTITAEPTNADTTEGFVELEATAAKLKVNKTGVEITETSPGDINLNVATDSSGTTEFTAVHIDGQTAANEAKVIVKQGALLAIEGSSNSQATIRSTNSGNVLLNVPASSGTLALTSDISALDTDDVSEGSNLYYTEARVSANSDVAANTAKNSYPSADATKLAGIAAGAEVNVIEAVVDDTTPQLGGDLDVQSSKVTTSTSNGSVILEPDGTGLVQINGDTNSGAIKLMCETGSHGVSIASPPHSAGATYDLVLPNSAGSANQVLKTDGNGNLSWTNQSTGGGSPTAYEEDSFETSANITMNSGVSTASNKIVDILGDALAAKDNANAKKLLGFHTGSGACVLQGMVDAGNSITGASAGSPLWLGSSGAFSATAPSTANEYSRVMGYYIATLQGGEVMCYFNPSIDWIQID